MWEQKGKVWEKIFKSFLEKSILDILKMSKIENLKKVLKKIDQTFIFLGNALKKLFYKKNML